MTTPTLREWLTTTLRDDSVAWVGLHALLGKSVTPYGIYQQWPPKSPVFPLVTVHQVTQTQDDAQLAGLRSIYFNLTAWGLNYEAVQDRIYDLLHREIPTTSDYHVLLVSFEQMVFEGLDDDFKCPFRQDRYLVKGVKL